MENQQSSPSPAVTEAAAENGQTARERASGYEYYDREILRIALRRERISEELFRQADENSVFRCSESRARSIRRGSSRRTATTLSPTKICSAIRRRSSASWAATRNCVIARPLRELHLLRGRDNVLNVFVTARRVMELRSPRNGETDGLNLEEAEKEDQEDWQRRADYFKYFTGRQWQDAALYDLLPGTRGT